jgi:hypothetical protein
MSTKTWFIRKVHNKIQTNKQTKKAILKWNLIYTMNYNLKWLWNCHSDNHQNPILHKPDEALWLEYIHAEMIYLCMWFNSSRCMSSPNNQKKNIRQVLHLYPCRPWHNNVLWSSGVRVHPNNQNSLSEWFFGAFFTLTLFTCFALFYGNSCSILI